MNRPKQSSLFHILAQEWKARTGMRKDCRQWGFVCLPFSCFATRKSQAERKTNSAFVSPIISGDLTLAPRRSKCVEEIRGISLGRLAVWPYILVTVLCAAVGDHDQVMTYEE